MIDHEGVYVSSPLIPIDTLLINSLLQSLGIKPNEHNYHLTLIDDRRHVKPPNLDDMGDYDTTVLFTAKVSKIEVLGHSIVLLLECPEAIEFNQLLTSKGLKHYYSHYLPHMSILHYHSMSDYDKITSIQDKFIGMKLNFIGINYE